MRIDGFINIPSVLQSMKPSSTPSAGSQSHASEDSSSVKLSSFGSVLQSVQREAAAQGKLREAKVAEITQSVQNGTLKMNMEKLAAQLIDLQVIDLER
jgi:flagellar biosynthesis anti-sigma factor FlgM